MCDGMFYMALKWYLFLTPETSSILNHNPCILVDRHSYFAKMVGQSNEEVSSSSALSFPEVCTKPKCDLPIFLHWYTLFLLESKLKVYLKCVESRQKLFAGIEIKWGWWVFMFGGYLYYQKNWFGVEKRKGFTCIVIHWWYIISPWKKYITMNMLIFLLFTKYILF